MKITYASMSDAGPRNVNEDSLAVWSNDDGAVVACVADGLGGMGGGDVASKLAIKTFRSNLKKQTNNPVLLRDLAMDAHNAIISEQSTRTSLRMATTFTAARIMGSNLDGVHCGDTRAVIARRNGIKRLTKDHSEGQRLFEAGKLSSDELATYPRKHILESALGDGDDPRIDEYQFDLEPGDRVVLTTDGVHGLIFLRELREMIARSHSPEMLVGDVKREIDKRGPNDNFSMIALFID